MQHKVRFMSENQISNQMKKCNNHNFKTHTHKNGTRKKMIGPTWLSNENTKYGYKPNPECVNNQARWWGKESIHRDWLRADAPRTAV